MSTPIRQRIVVIMLFANTMKEESDIVVKVRIKVSGLLLKLLLMLLLMMLLIERSHAGPYQQFTNSLYFSNLLHNSVQSVTCVSRWLQDIGL